MAEHYGLTAAESLRLDKIRDRHTDAIQHLANLRLLRLTRWWRRHFSPRHMLEITFGMGSELIEVDGEQVCFDGEWERGPHWRGRRVECLAPIGAAMLGVDEITDGYRVACPDDIKVIGER